MTSYLLGHVRGTGRLVCMTVLAAALLGCALPQAASAELESSTGLGANTELGGSAEPEISLTPSTTKPYTPCPPGGSVAVECNLVIDPVPIKTASGYQLPDGGPMLEGSGEKGGFDPEDLQSAYKIPTSGGSGETVAVVDAYGDKTAESDLAEYRAKYKLPECKKENAKKEVTNCFRKVNEKGEEGEANEPKAGPPIWGGETALDIEMVSAACPSCHILLVEASGEDPKETAASVEEAVKLGATEISNSYGYPEEDETLCPSKKGCSEYLAAYNHAGIPITVSGGDSGYDGEDNGWHSPSWPATSPNVIAVGGTVLKKEVENWRGWSEKVWPYTGSGCSLHELEPTWQEAKAFPKACHIYRTDNDVAAVAEGVSIYSTPFEGGWGNVGGTSASAPFIAGVEAHATSATKKLGADAFYEKPSMLVHISEGSNGSCGTESSETYYLCHATKEGYNGPTGWGTPHGVFEIAAPSATTAAASSITKTGATLNGTLNPEGSETKYDFEYGTTESYGTKTAEASAGSGTSNVEESKTITGLTVGKKYHFRIVATNTHGTTDGSDRTFTAENPPENTELPVVSPATPDQAVPESTTTGTWINSPTSYAYQWERCNATGGVCAAISGATSSKYTPVEADVGHTLVVKVTATNQAGVNSASSKATNKVKPIGEITEYALPSGYPEGIVAGPDGNLWFANFTNAIGKITTSGTVTEYTLPKLSYPEGITAGPDGNLWFTDLTSNKIGKITTSGTITEYALPTNGGERKPAEITAGPDGNLWFTEAGSVGNSYVAKITTSGTITEYALPEQSGPHGITVGPDDNIWFTEGGRERIGKITTSGTITEYSLPEKSGAEGITAGPDGNLWFTNYSQSKIGKITTSGTVTEYSLPSGSEPEYITAGPDGNLWFTDNGTSKIGRITTSGTITEYSLPSGSQPLGIAVGPDDNLWFTDWRTGKIGVITP